MKAADVLLTELDVLSRVVTTLLICSGVAGRSQAIKARVCLVEI